MEDPGYPGLHHTRPQCCLGTEVHRIQVLLGVLALANSIRALQIKPRFGSQIPRASVSELYKAILDFKQGVTSRQCSFATSLEDTKSLGKPPHKRRRPPLHPLRALLSRSRAGGRLLGDLRLLLLQKVKAILCVLVELVALITS